MASVMLLSGAAHQIKVASPVEQYRGLAGRWARLRPYAEGDTVYLDAMVPFWYEHPYTLGAAVGAVVSGIATYLFTRSAKRSRSR
jgi:hypothetical protein